MFTLIRNATVYAPALLGKRDILICGSKVVAIDTDLGVTGLPECHELDAKGRIVVPGFVDGHVHLIGGGGEGGFHTRTPEVDITKLTTNGITTVAGLLGTDALSRHPESLYAKACGLRREGLSAYMFTGGYKVPSPTITGSVDKDIAFIDAVIGVKVAIADHRSAQITVDELARLASQARVGGMLTGKAGSVVVHLGNSIRGMSLLREIVETTDIPAKQFIPTHVNRNQSLFREAVEWAKTGGYIDFSAGAKTPTPVSGPVKTSMGIMHCLGEGVSLAQMCMSTDGNGSLPRFDESGALIKVGVAGFTGLLEEVTDLVADESLPLEKALCPVTQNPAAALGLSAHKGALAPGYDADLLILDENMKIDHVFAMGKAMVRNAEPVVFGTFAE